MRRLDEIGAHGEKDNPEAAARVIARIVTAAGHLAEQPRWGVSGASTGHGNSSWSKPYIIPHRVDGETVEILTVMHAAQRWLRPCKSLGTQVRPYRLRRTTRNSRAPETWRFRSHFTISCA
ncbi:MULTISPECIES: type II toxin-antitoxin system RelE/ParE family toxin [unclassified Mesorhizobium]|uniref:type II toxin-antitoxin system RelE/ParE family toxin n=1 Tax=unclassified Mesorhizobium TaxID=325217 RepID=UPI0032AE8A14